MVVSPTSPLPLQNSNIINFLVLMALRATPLFPTGATAFLPFCGLPYQIVRAICVYWHARFSSHVCSLISIVTDCRADCYLMPADVEHLYTNMDWYDTLVGEGLKNTIPYRRQWPSQGAPLSIGWLYSQQQHFSTRRSHLPPGMRNMAMGARLWLLM